VQPAVLFSRMQSQERILWEQPSQELSMVAFGAIARLTSHGTQRFAQISAGWCGLLSRTLVDAPPLCPLSAPVGLGGFAFDPARRADSTWEGYPDALLVLPRFLFVSYRGSSWLCVHELVAAECDTHTVQAGMDSIHGVVDFLSSLQAKEATPEEPEPSESLLVEQDEMQAARWKEKVRAIVGEIASGKLEKLVLARSVNAYSPRPLNPGAVVRKLRSGYSHCTLFAFTSRQGCFVGATPESLVRLEGRTVRTDCLAGSTRRGTTDDEDRAFGQALLADCKERREHALVRRALRNVLEPLCVQLSAPETPGLLRLPNVQHLHTPLEGVLKQTNDIFALVAAPPEKYCP
jgi:isochorismate synthase EntC